MAEPTERDPTSPASDFDTRGMGLALGAYVWWGLSPLFWRLVSADALDTVAHRTIWTAATLALAHTLGRRWSEVRRIAADKANRRRALAAGALLGVNWLVFVWAVNADRVVEASLGYFINPLVNVVLGVVVLGERLKRIQWLAVSIAAAGVAWLWVLVGAVPWVALVLAGTFGFYGLIRKTADYGSLDGLSLEAGVLALPALVFLLVRTGGLGGDAPVWGDGALDVLLLLCTGLFTAVPLLLFAAAARRIPLSVIGIVQYVSPSLQLVLGLFAFGEILTDTQLVGYALVWIALAIFAADSVVSSRRVAA